MSDGNRFTGVAPALVTPMRPDGAIDHFALEDHFSWVLHQGVDVLVPCGTTGESVTLSDEEQKEVIAACVRISRGRVPVLAGAGTNDTRHAAELAAAAAEAGADGILSVTPYYNRPTVDGLIAHFRAVADASGLPLILYNVPGRTGLNVTPDDLFRIVDAVPAVVGVKEASGDLAQIIGVLHRRPPGFVVLSGDDELTLPVMALGGDGVISVIANEAPGPMSELVHAARDGDWSTARELHATLLPLMRANFATTNPVPVKTALELMGRAPANFRLPLLPLSARSEVRSTLRSALEIAGLIEPFAPPGT
ncbi:MAG: 4-hydroxy-tetrahydrodipicolinate synthase [Gemmatimonadetes bacterium]|nr:4-hydroxy-tetrahydrodipicolinate synthase [Gemmatimonadota bacterium]MBT8402571.1 4-hydroxy-tetrahydrodipicolinate synthase [Gemmatimonadota bacterium]NNK63213.1 4-hydroxy-tetrahydrodipicolinate synthase [Gemmatimonadota bacterium]